MNCKQFNTIPLEEVLLSLGHLPTKQSEKEAWFLNPFAKENHASFKINKNQNIWYLFSEGIGGNNIDFMKKYLNASVKEVLEWAENQNFSSFQQQETSNSKLENLSKNYEIIEIKNVQHPALLEYLKERNVGNQTQFLQEIHYRMNDKNYFGIVLKMILAVTKFAINTPKFVWVKKMFLQLKTVQIQLGFSKVFLIFFPLKM